MSDLWKGVCSRWSMGVGRWSHKHSPSQQSFSLGLIDYREQESNYVYASHHCRRQTFRAGVQGKEDLRAGGKTRPRWDGPTALGIGHRAVLDRRLKISRL